MLSKQTGFVNKKINGLSDAGNIFEYSPLKYPGLEKKEGYFLTEQELTDLLGKAFTAGVDRNYHLNNQDDKNGTWAPNSTQYIDTLLKQ